MPNPVLEGLKRQAGLEMKTGRSFESLARFLLQAIQMVDEWEVECCQ